MPQHDNGVDLADLCRRCGEGDEAAFSDVYRRFGGVLYGAALRILKSPPEAEEVVQEAFLTLYRKAAETPPNKLGGWLHRVTVNRSLDRLRSRKRRSEVQLFEDHGAAAGELETGASRAAPAASGTPAATSPEALDEAGTAVAGYAFGLDIGRAVERLPERARMVFVLHDVEGFKHREIAELMDISDGSSKSQLFRARALVREWLEQGGDNR